MNGDFDPRTLALARDVLDIVGHANARFTASLREDQKAALAQHPFDFADYLRFGRTRYRNRVSGARP